MQTLVPQNKTSHAPMLNGFSIPFLIFMLLMGGGDLIRSFGNTEFLLAKPQYWIYPLQVVACGALLIRYWRQYSLEAPKQILLTVGVGLLVFGIWVCPQVLLGAPPRLNGFDPTVFPPGSPLYWGTLVFRFTRLVIVVPLVEEIFWRGFLMRYLIREDFQTIPVGTFTWLSFGVVALCFGAAHWGLDFGPAVITGVLYNALAVRTRSVSSCVLAHSLTNLLLGVYIMTTRQWGFW